MIQCFMDNVKFDRKPTDEVATITRRLKLTEFTSIEELAVQVVVPNGRTWTPATFVRNGVRNNKAWIGQQLFALDFDNGIAKQDFLDRCDKYRVHPVFMYETFSSVNESKFRAVFMTTQYIDAIQVRDYIQKALMGIFPEADAACKDAARMYYGGKQIIYTNYNAYLDLENLTFALVDCMEAREKSHYSHSIQRLCQSSGVLLKNSIPYFIITNSTSKPEITTPPESGEKKGFQYSIYWSPKLSPESGGVHNLNNEIVKAIGTPSQQWIGIAIAPMKSISTNDKVSYTKTANIEEPVNIELIDVDIASLAADSVLIDDFINGVDLRVQGELEPVMFGLITNLAHFKDARQFFARIVSKYPHYTTDRHPLDYYLAKFSQVRRSNYAPKTIIDFYPKETCDFTNLVLLAQSKQKEVRKVENIETISLAEGERRFDQAFYEALQLPYNAVTAIKAPTGIGKTERYLRLRSVVIALPTWKVVDDVSRRMTEAGCDHIVYPRLPDVLDAQVRETIDRLYAQGNHKLAKSYLSMYEHIEEVHDFLRAEESIKSRAHGQPILITHERLMYFKSPYETIIIDEDPFKTLLSLHTLEMKDFGHMVTSFVSKTDNKPNKKHNKVLTSIRDELYEASEMLVHPVPDYMLDSAYMEKLAIHVGSTLKTINTNVLGFFTAKYFYKYEDRITYIHKRRLPVDKKIIILSATVNEILYRHLIPDIIYKDIGIIEIAGKLIQFVDASYSRYQIDQDPERLGERVLALTRGGKYLITHMNYDKYFEGHDKLTHFNNTTGIDTAAGKDLVVVGTPHVDPSVYVLYAKALGIDIENRTFGYERIEHNGFSFFFSTYTDNEALREVQLYIIESELVQAVGRARLLRYNSTVYVFSNLPLHNATLKNGKKELRKQKVSAAYPPAHLDMVSPLTI